MNGGPIPKHLVAIAKKGDYAGWESFQPRAASSRVGVLDECFERIPSKIIISWKRCLEHLAYRHHDWFHLLDASHLRPKLVRIFDSLFPDVARSAHFIYSRAADTLYLSRSRHRSIVPKIRSQSLVVTP